MYILVIFKAPNKPVPKWKESLSLITLKLGKKKRQKFKKWQTLYLASSCQSQTG
jgi:hypothetical protein